MTSYARVAVSTLIAITALSVSALAMAQPTTHSDNSFEAPEGGFTTPSGSAVLYDQIVDFGGSAITSQNFLDPVNDVADNQAADDFTVTDPEGWDVTHVDVAGVYTLGPADSVNVWFYEDSAGSPGTEVCSYSNLGYSDPFGQSGNLEIELSTECTLAAGTYWVSVQINMAFAVGGQWYWAEVATQFGNASQWQNPPDGFGTGCTTYMPRASCGIEFTGPDLAFAILGRVNEPRATFAVDKEYSDGNTSEVDVMLECNTGLPLQQPATISPGDGVNYVVGDYADGEMDCTVTETAGQDGYSVNYFNGATNSSEGCSYEDIPFGAVFTCLITNTLQQVTVDVTKEWVDDHTEFQAQNIAEAYWYCSNVSIGGGPSNGSASGWLYFYGNPGSDDFSVYPDWETGTSCSITEVDLLESGIEVDDSDCDGMVLYPDSGDSCTIVNTRLYEGIPTLSQNGLALLALLMLGMGFVAYRRFA